MHRGPASRHLFCGDRRLARQAVGYRPETSRGLNDDVIGLVRGAVDRSKDVLAFKEGVIPKNFVEGGPGREKLQYVSDAETLAAKCKDGPRTCPPQQ